MSMQQSVEWGCVNESSVLVVVRDNRRCRDEDAFMLRTNFDELDHVRQPRRDPIIIQESSS